MSLRLELEQPLQLVPILDRPEERSQSNYRLGGSVITRSSNPRSPRRTIAIRLIFPRSLIILSFQSSIAPKNDRNSIGTYHLHPRTVPILDRPEERSQSLELVY